MRPQLFCCCVPVRTGTVVLSFLSALASAVQIVSGFRQCFYMHHAGWGQWLFVVAMLVLYCVLELTSWYGLVGAWRRQREWVDWYLWLLWVSSNKLHLYLEEFSSDPGWPTGATVGVGRHRSGLPLKHQQRKFRSWRPHESKLTGNRFRMLKRRTRSTSACRRATSSSATWPTSRYGSVVRKYTSTSVGLHAGGDQRLANTCTLPSNNVGPRLGDRCPPSQVSAPFAAPASPR